MSVHHELRELYPDWAKITPAKKRILEYLVSSGGEVQFWPGHLVRSLGPRRRLEHVGYIETWQRAEDRYAKTAITDDGRAALAAVLRPSGTMPETARHDKFHHPQGASREA